MLPISHLGDIMPSGFLPVPAGNVRQDDIVQVYRESSSLIPWRNPDLLKGKCGILFYRQIFAAASAAALMELQAIIWRATLPARMCHK